MNELIIPLIIKYKYVAIFPIAVIEGPIIALVAGFLVSLGYLKFIQAYIILVIADITGDIIYYYVGYFSNKKKFLEKYGSRFPAVLRNFNMLDNLWEKHERKTILLSKLSYGLCIPFLMSAGISRMPIKRYVTYVTIIDLIKFGVIMAIGYFLGYSFQKAESYILYFGIAVAVILIIFIIVYILYSKKYAIAEITEIENENK
ncbi:MAG: hypothetical protein A2V96_01635 [Candidatus Yonathbacteria bacterium RBG_16_43_6]|uniref:DedA family protein n=1 Tax=Candidatus Yonathbacteria bacterium RIFCSPLOWO2_01_FULL_43_27 TaxID=1802726 RepID=A0A1G2SD31_9BACT|nr:MAG: hypothetical protein A2V96_01635 [Candidatus Yonathbacteria bacterium RBG_16_43_6]OHA78941.1 MAG: hypothetical protein A2658_01230 [Candidatus Yonathbacteria bacterium RIFCSPHIGHO2_01_FULL_44_19]OHA82579.1 MAG: hypothetical protein A3B07_01440 [Candidatus Yonathbacteria bacterium RIFCSPLOWO2_01_FULL_43_27]